VTPLDSQRKGETTHRYPFFLPDGKHFLFIRAGHAAAPDDEVNSLWVGSLEGEEPIELMHTVSNAAYAMGHLFYLRDQFLFAQPFDPNKLKFTGVPFVVGEGVVFQPSYWRGAFAVAEGGQVAFQGGLGLERRSSGTIETESSWARSVNSVNTARSACRATAAAWRRRSTNPVPGTATSGSSTSPAT
jgi:hypothetical protein